MQFWMKCETASKGRLPWVTGTLRQFGAGRATVAILSVALVSACSGPESSACAAAFGDDETFLLPDPLSCPTCSVENLRSAVDGQLSTGAEINFNSPAGGTYSLDIVRGARFAAGGRPGAYLTVPNSPSVQISIELTTYLDGEMQESIDCQSGAGSDCSAILSSVSGANSIVYYGGQSTTEFDQLRLSISVIGTAESPSVSVNEVCGSQ